MEILFNLLLSELAPVGYCLRVGGMQQEMGSMGGGGLEPGTSKWVSEE